jgi:hypothetical protein
MEGSECVLILDIRQQLCPVHTVGPSDGQSTGVHYVSSNLPFTRPRLHDAGRNINPVSDDRDSFHFHITADDDGLSSAVLDIMNFCILGHLQTLPLQICLPLISIVLQKLNIVLHSFVNLR